MRDVLGNWVLAADLGDTDVGGFASFGEGVVARVEVFALLKLVLKEILLVGQLAVELEQSLLVRRQPADVDLVLLMRVHRELRGAMNYLGGLIIDNQNCLYCATSSLGGVRSWHFVQRFVCPSLQLYSL